MNARIVLTVCLLLWLCSSPVLAGPQEQSGNEGAIASYEKAISQAKSKKEEALQRKKLGDYYLSQDDYSNAAGQFIKALAIQPSPFTIQDRVRMAISIASADRVDDAVHALQQVLAEDPKDRDARVQLAKFLSWSDKLDEAESEADTVLRAYPGNQDALIVKANVLRWKGKAKESMPLYEKALQKSENFEARLGLASAHLEAGDKASAQENAGLARPRYPYQEKELRKFNDAFCATRPTQVGGQYSYYHDSDDNRVNRYSLFFGAWLRDWESEIRYTHIDAVDPARNEEAEEVSLKTYARHGNVGTGAGLGVIRRDRNSNTLVAGHEKVDVDLGWGTAGMRVARDVLTDTAQLIENKIALVSETLPLSQRATTRLLFTESYSHAEYSDSNGADDLRLGFRYAVLTTGPKIDAGYRFQYWNFRRQSGSGYFDPKDFTEHQVFISLYAEHEGFYVFLEPYGGYQDFARSGTLTHQLIGGGSASAGWHVKRCTSFEITAEGGNNAGATTAGFNYYQIGFRFSLFI